MMKGTGKLIEKVCLYCRDKTQNIDKVYEIELTETEGGFLVTGYNGRRSAKLTPQPKTPFPVSINAARQVFNELEAAKTNHPRTPYKVLSRNVGDMKTESVLIKSATIAQPLSEPRPGSVNNETSAEAGRYQATCFDALEM